MARVFGVSGPCALNAQWVRLSFLQPDPKGGKLRCKPMVQNSESPPVLHEEKANVFMRVYNQGVTVKEKNGASDLQRVPSPSAGVAALLHCSYAL